LKPDGRMVFTYQHKTAMAWYALASAIASTNLRPIQLFPLLGDGSTGLHKHEGTSTWDAVFVMVKSERSEQISPLSLSEALVNAARNHYAYWARRLARQTASMFREADRRNFYRACLVAGASHLFSASQGPVGLIPLITLLEENPPPI